MRAADLVEQSWGSTPVDSSGIEPATDGPDWGVLFAAHDTAERLAQ
jgi:hypothetical protein